MYYAIKMMPKLYVPVVALDDSIQWTASAALSDLIPEVPWTAVVFP